MRTGAFPLDLTLVERWPGSAQDEAGAGLRDIEFKRGIQGTLSKKGAICV
jgi:hypothetical protein